MTESVVAQEPSAVRAAMEAELLAVDAIARFKFDDGFQIHHFGETIDSIPNLSPEANPTPKARRSMSRYVLLLEFCAGVIRCCPHLDLQDQLPSSQPPLSFPASQERFAELRRATQFESYIQFSQSQSTGGSQASERPPAPNQQANQQQLLQPPVVPSSDQERTGRTSQKLQVPSRARSTSRELSPVRKSTRPAAPKIMPGYVMGDADTELPSAAAMSSRLRQSSSSTSGARRRSPSPLVAGAPAKKKGRANPVPSRNIGTAEEREQLAQAKVPPTSPEEQRRPLRHPPVPASSMVTRSLARAESQEPPLISPPARRQVASSSRVPMSSPSADLQFDVDDEDGPSFLVILAAQQSKASSSSREVVKVATSTTNALTVPRDDKQLSQAAREAKLAAPMFENDIHLSRAAKASLFGWTVAEGYEGFKYLNTFQKGD